MKRFFAENIHFFRSSFLSGGAIVIRGSARLIANKIIATVYGPEGITFLSHFQNLTTIITSIQVNGVHRGVLKYLSEKEVTPRRFQSIFSAGILFNMLFMLFGGIILFFYLPRFTALFEIDYGIWLWGILIFLSVFLQLFNLFFLAVLLAREKIKIYTLFQVITAILAVGTVFILAGDIPLYLLLVFYIFSQGITVFATVFFTGWKRVRVSLSFLKEWKSLKDIGKFIVMAVCILLFGNIVELAVREFSILRFSAEETGLWQAAAKYSEYFFLAFTALTGVIFYPKLSKYSEEKSELRKLFRSIILPIGGGTAAYCILSYLFREEILLVLFDSTFTEAAFLFDYQMAGDFLKAAGFLMTFLITAKARTGLFILTQSFSAAVYLLSIYLIIDQFGIETFPAAYFYRFLIYDIFVFFLIRKWLF